MTTSNPICILLNLFVIALFGRIILSWFPIQPGTAMASIYRALHTVTEPVLGPVRRVVPPLGMFDLSPFIVIIVAQLIQARVCGGRGFLF
jgi:YggT family protein